MLGNGIVRAVSFYEFLDFLCQFVAKSISFRRSHQRCSVEKYVLRNFAKSQKITCGRVSFNKVANLKPATLLKKRLWHRPFPVSFVKYLKTPFLQNTSDGCFCSLQVVREFQLVPGSSSSFQVMSARSSF